MGVTNLDFLHGVLLPSGALVAELTDCTPAAGVQAIAEMAAGSTIPDFVGAHSAAPTVDFTSPQVKTILDAAGLYGYDMSGGNCDLLYRRAAVLGTRAALSASSHLRLRIVKSILYWTSVTARQGGNAEIACRIVPRWDGTNAPLVPAGSQAIGNSALANQFYTLGPVKLQGALLPGVTGWTLDLGVKPIGEAGDGDLWPSFVGIGDHTPVLRVTTRTLDAWGSYGVTGTALSALTFALRCKAADLAGNVADGTASHIVFTAVGGGMIVVENSGGGANGPAQASVAIHLRRADTSAAHALSVSTASAIS